MGQPRVEKTSTSCHIFLPIFGDAFSQLSSSPVITEEDESILVCLVFCKDKSIKSVDKGRLHLHQKGQPFERLPPSKELQESGVPGHYMETIFESSGYTFTRKANLLKGYYLRKNFKRAVY